MKLKIAFASWHISIGSLIREYIEGEQYFHFLPSLVTNFLELWSCLSSNETLVCIVTKSASQTEVCPTKSEFGTKPLKNPISLP